MDKQAEVHILVKIRAVVCPMLVMFCVGSYYCFSNINPYVAAYLNSQSEDDITDTDTLLVMSVWLMTQSIFSIISVKLADSVGYWNLNILSFSMFALMNLIVSFVKSYPLFIFVYGFLNGLSIGIGYLPALYISWTYFPRHKSIVTGAILFSAGISGIVLSPLSTMIVNPNNIDLKDIRNRPEVYMNVPRMFRIMSAIFGVIAVVGGLLQPKPYVYSMTKEEFLDIRATKEIFGRDVTNILKLELIRDLNDAPTSQNALILGQMTDEAVEQLAMASPNVKRMVRNRLASMNTLRETAKLQLNVEETGSVVEKTSRGDNELNIDTNQSQETIETPLIGPEDRIQSSDENAVISRNYTRDIQCVQRATKDQVGSPNTARMTANQELMNDKRITLVQAAEELEAYDCPSMAVAVTSWPFFNICVLAFCCSTYNYFLNACWKKFYPHQFDVDDTQMSLLLSIGALSNSVIRLVVGLLLMRYSFKTIYLINIIIACLNSLTVLKFTTTYEVGAIYLALSFAGLGTQITIFPMICLKMFGPTIGPKMYPCAFFMFSAASMCQYLVLKLANDDWQLITRIFAGVTIVGLIFAIPFNQEYDWKPIIEKLKKKEEEEEKHRRLRDKQNLIKRSMLSTIKDK